MAKESSIQKRIWVAMSKLGYRMFRNNVGQAWQGTSIPVSGGFAVMTANNQRLKIPAGSVLILGARPFRAGLTKGSSDLIGWRTIEITPDMVGSKVAQFVAAEIKAPTGRETTEQKTWRATVAFAGGEALLLRDASDLQKRHNNDE